VSLTFPTRLPHRRELMPPPGMPVRAKPCRCIPRAFLIRGQDTCFRCGLHPERTINQTWADRARDASRRPR